MKDSSSPRTAVSCRQHWMSVLANAPFSTLSEYWQQMKLDPQCEVVRQPEIGVARLQGKVGNTGERFNFADTTITRAVVRLSDGTLGYAYLRGRSKQHALLSAMIDALLQQKSYTDLLLKQIIDPLFDLQQQSRQQVAEQAAESKVDFFTVVRGED